MNRETRFFVYHNNVLIFSTDWLGIRDALVAHRDHLSKAFKAENGYTLQAQARDISHEMTEVL